MFLCYVSFHFTCNGKKDFSGITYKLDLHKGPNNKTEKQWSNITNGPEKKQMPKYNGKVRRGPGNKYVYQEKTIMLIMDLATNICQEKTNILFFLSCQYLLIWNLKTKFWFFRVLVRKLYQIKGFHGLLLSFQGFSGSTRHPVRNFV